jgi:hypothetical protein
MVILCNGMPFKFSHKYCSRNGLSKPLQDQNIIKSLINITIFIDRIVCDRRRGINELQQHPSEHSHQILFFALNRTASSAPSAATLLQREKSSIGARRQPKQPCKRSNDRNNRRKRNSLENSESVFCSRTKRLLNRK